MFNLLNLKQLVISSLISSESCQYHYSFIDRLKSLLYCHCHSQGALDERSDSSKVVDAHRNLLSVYDQLISTCTQLGLAALPCPVSESSLTIKASTLDEMHTRLSIETKETFERRERLREGSSIVTSILTQQHQPSR